MPSPLPQRLRDPPEYVLPTASKTLPSREALPSYGDDPPSYSSLSESQLRSSETSKSALREDVLHFLDHEHDSVQSLSLRYGVPVPILKRANNLSSDYLLLARRTVVIPREYYHGGVSLSPRPVAGEDEERRKTIVRKWMMACKVSEYEALVMYNDMIKHTLLPANHLSYPWNRYDIALFYLGQHDYDLGKAISAYDEDEIWGREHPLEANTKNGKARQVIGRR